MKPADTAMFAAADQRLIDVSQEPPAVLLALLSLAADGRSDCQTLSPPRSTDDNPEQAA